MCDPVLEMGREKNQGSPRVTEINRDFTEGRIGVCQLPLTWQRNLKMSFWFSDIGVAGNQG